MSYEKPSMWFAVVLIGLMITTLIIGFHQHASSFDDAYITYRYARNIALGRGFVYNSGESVLGTTTPLYTLLLAGLSLVWPDIPLLSHSIGVLAWTLCVPVIYGIGQIGSHKDVGIIAATFIAFNSRFLNVLGMETPLYVLLTLSTFYLCLKEHSTWAALFSGLTFLIRWDGILVVGVFLFTEIIKKKKTFFLACIVCASIILPWLLYSYVTFGSIFPNSFFAKAGQGWNQGLGGTEVGSFGQGLLLLVKSASAVNCLYCLFPILGGLGVYFAFRDKVQWWPLLLWVITYLCGYIALGVLRLEWYYTPLAPPLALLMAEGIVIVAKFISQHDRLSLRRFLFIVILLVLCLVPHVDMLITNQRTEMAVRTTTYVRTAQWLKDHTKADSSVAMLEIGIIGFYSDRTVIDVMGLVSPEMIGHLDNWKQLLQFALNYYWPDYVITLERTAWGEILNELWFKEAYVFEAQIENTADPVTPVGIYHLREGFRSREFNLDSTFEVVFDNELTLHKFQVEEDSIKQGDRLHLQLVWEAQTNINTDYRLQFELLNAADGQLWTLASGLQPMRGSNPTYLWLNKDSFVDYHTLPVPDDIINGYYLLRLNVLGKDGFSTLSQTMNHSITHISMGPIQIGDDFADIAQPTYPATVAFTEDIRFQGYDLETTEDNSLSVTLYWQAIDDISKDYTVFVHLLSSDGELVAQHDSPPHLPTSMWVPWIQITDYHNLVLPTEFISDVYQMRIGLYRWPEMERVIVNTAGCLDAANNALHVGQISFGDTQTPHQTTCPDLHWIEIKRE